MPLKVRLPPPRVRLPTPLEEAKSLMTPANVVPAPAPAPVTVKVVGEPPLAALPRTMLLPDAPPSAAMLGLELVKSTTLPPDSARPPVGEAELPSAELFEAMSVLLLTVVGPA